MNRLLKRGLNAYKIFLKNKLVMSIMMLVSGIMMFIAAMNGKGNDVKTLPILITIAGVVFSFWAFYRLGYIKSNIDKLDESRDKRIEKRGFYLQIVEASIYTIISGLGIFLLVNESFTNTVLDLMAGGFTTLNGVIGVINTVKGRNDIDFRWKFMLVLTILELILGPFFIFKSNTIDLNGYLLMGTLTTVAGLIEVISSLSMQTLRDTISDSKEIVKKLKED